MRLIVLLFIFIGIWNYSPASNNLVSQSARDIPLIASVDVVIVGGTTAAVSAAVEASSHGACVFLIAPRLYLGEDMCATLRLKVAEDCILKTNLEEQLFSNELEITPLKVKATLNHALLDANVNFVFGSFATDILWDENHIPSGVIIVNRAGRQAIAAKTIIDATPQAWVCKMAGAKSNDATISEIEFERTLIMPGLKKDEPLYVRRKLTIPMNDLTFPSFAKAEQIARKETYSEVQLRASESLFFIPPNPIVCNKNVTEWTENSETTLEFFQPKGFNNLYVLSGSAGIPREVAKDLLQPAALCSIGEKIGEAASNSSIEKIFATKFFLHNKAVATTELGDVKEILTGLRPIHENENVVRLQESSVPVISDYEVVVVGGGTSGAPAAIAAARMGMKVLVVEFQEGLGGVGTLGLIGKPWYGRKVGFAAEVPFPQENIEPKMEWYRSELEKAGGDIWLGTLGCGAYVDGNKVKGAVVATPAGRVVVKAKVVIDATGNADVAIAAGAQYMYGEIEKGDIALQGTGLSSRSIVGNYLNTDYLLVNEMDMTDVWRTLVSVQQTKFSEGEFDAGTLIQSRERHRVVGDFVLHYLDQITGRTFPDAIVFSQSDYDSHGYPSSDYFALLPHDSISRKQNHPAPGGTCYTPFRCLLPKGLDGILVTGLGISMERDASAMIRMQLDLANQGYAAGMASAIAVSEDKSLREIDIKELQKYLVEKGNLPEEVLSQKDSYPFSRQIVQQAVIDYGKASNPEQAGKPLAIILTHQETAIPLVKTAFLNVQGKQKLQYAQVLGMCGEKDGVEIMIDELRNIKTWDEKIFQGSLADFAHLPTPVDALILALGNSGDERAIPVLIDLVEKLDSGVTLSHFRSVALALEKFACREAAEPLAQLLQKEGMSGFAMANIEQASTQLGNDGKGPNPVRNASSDKRTKALREIVLARALYKCGDYNNIGETTLKSYRNDMRGLFAQHAKMVLEANERILETGSNKTNKFKGKIE
ncbi:FAD-dependent oxidoreductase [uncultured Draconibacterium sp.]|uniref:FAD-dependent oxidoreductase n=1 Tax=uncultured Draconibacterium sp. TaxID=1573823 RepID=UPI003217B53C